MAPKASLNNVLRAISHGHCRLRCMFVYQRTGNMCSKWISFFTFVTSYIYEHIYIYIYIYILSVIHWILFYMLMIGPLPVRYVHFRAEPIMMSIMYFSPRINSELLNIFDWLTVNKLCHNIEKTDRKWRYFWLEGKWWTDWTYLVFQFSGLGDKWIYEF